MDIHECESKDYRKGGIKIKIINEDDAKKLNLNSNPIHRPR